LSCLFDEKFVTPIIYRQFYMRNIIVMHTTDESKNDSEVMSVLLTTNRQRSSNNISSYKDMVPGK